MAVAEQNVKQQVSMIAFLTAIVRRRALLMGWAFACATLTAAWALTRPPRFVASASFFSQVADAGRSGLASLADQFGVALSATTQTVSPEFYSRLAKSPVVLRRIARDSFALELSHAARKSFPDLFDIPAGPTSEREEKSVKLLQRLVNTSVYRPTGVVELSVTTAWPQVSLSIETAILDGLNDFNRRTKQSQANAERTFIESRLEVARSDLRAAEEKLEGFLMANRQSPLSPQLAFQRDRLVRELGIRQQVFTALANSFEEVRIREVRDTPAITIIDAPFVPSLPEPRGVLAKTFFGGMAGLMIGIIWVLVRMAAGNGSFRAGEMDALSHAVRDAKMELSRFIPGRWNRR